MSIAQFSNEDTSLSDKLRIRMKSRASGASNITIFNSLMTIDYNAYHSFIPYFILNNTSIDMNKDEEIVKEINIEEWKKSLDYTDEESESLLKSLLKDYDIDLTDDNIKWLKEQIYSIINSYEHNYTVTLEKDTKQMLYNLIIRMSYDKLCVKPFMK